MGTNKRILLKSYWDRGQRSKNGDRPSITGIVGTYAIEVVMWCVCLCGGHEPFITWRSFTTLLLQILIYLK